MRQKKGEGTKIAQAAKELDVTSVTIRRYITEFNIETTADDNGIKVLPAQAMEELQEIRKLKEEGLTNPKVLEILEESRSKSSEKESKGKGKEKEKEKAEPAARRVTRKVETPAAKRKAAAAKIEEEEEEAPVAKKAAAKVVKEDDEEEGEEDDDNDGKEELPVASSTTADGKSKYSLTCQTCQKTFEHMNPRLRDCLDCYRVKRKERRRGGDKHKNVIQNPIAQQVVSKNQQAQTLAQQSTGPAAMDLDVPMPAALAPVAREREPRKVSVREQINFAPVGTTPPIYQKSQVRSYRKAIEETRQITSNLKRRLERPDLPESERRFLEQIYAYQLILHQGWKHLSEYKQMPEGVSGGSGGSGGNRHE